MVGLPETTEQPKKRRKQTEVRVAPAWEKTRSFALEKRNIATLPVIQDNGEFKRINIPRVKFSAKAAEKTFEAQPKPDLASESGLELRAESHEERNGAAIHSRELRAPQRKNARKKLEAYAQKIEDFEATKVRIAGLASRIVASPEDNVALLAELRKLAHHYKGGAAALIILTESQLYKDVIPSYRIRQISEKEAETKVSKEVARLRQYEESLLFSYQRYVRSCISLTRWRNGGGTETEASRDMRKVRLAACKALSELARSLAHFNEAEEVMNCVCSLIADREKTVRRQCCEALKALLGDAHRASGQTLQMCVLITKQLAAVAVGKTHAAPAEAVEPLVGIQFSRFARLPPSSKAKNAPKKSKRFIKKRRRKPEKHPEDVDENELEKDIREGDAEATPQELYKARKKLLDFVCHAYFNIVKCAAESVGGESEMRRLVTSRKRKPPAALPAALKGLLRVAKFINTSIIEAIVSALTPLLEGTRLPLSMRFQCLSAAYAVLSVHARTQQADPDSFTGDARAIDRSLYTALGCLFGPEMPAKEDESITFQAMEAVLSCNNYREVPLARCAAIARRLIVKAAASATTHACSVGLLLIAQGMLPSSLASPIFLQRGNAMDGELGTDLGVIQTYDMKTDDPEITSAERSVAWELSSLMSHFHPAVREIATKCASGYSGTRLPERNENILLEVRKYSSEEGGFNPPPSSVHPVKMMRRGVKRRRGLLEDSVLRSTLSDKELRDFVSAEPPFPGEHFILHFQSA